MTDPDVPIFTALEEERRTRTGVFAGLEESVSTPPADTPPLPDQGAPPELGGAAYPEPVEPVEKPADQPVPAPSTSEVLEVVRPTGRRPGVPRSQR